MKLLKIKLLVDKKVIQETLNRIGISNKKTKVLAFFSKLVQKGIFVNEIVMKIELPQFYKFKNAILEICFLLGGVDCN